MKSKEESRFVIREADIFGSDAERMLGELGRALAALTGSSGDGSFCREDVLVQRSAFLIGYLDGESIACGRSGRCRKMPGVRS